MFGAPSDFKRADGKVMTSIIRKKLRGWERNKREKVVSVNPVVQKQLSRRPKVLRRTRWKRSKGESKDSAQCILPFAKRKKKKYWRNFGTHTQKTETEKSTILSGNKLSILLCENEFSNASMSAWHSVLHVQKFLCGEGGAFRNPPHHRASLFAPFLSL